MGSSPVRRRIGPRAAAAAAAAAAAMEAAATSAAGTTDPTGGPGPGGRRPRPRLRVTVVRRGEPGSNRRWVLDTGTLGDEPGARLHELVDEAEAPGAPAGPPGDPGRPARHAPGYEVTVARGYGHWTVRVADGATPPSVAALIDHVIDQGA